MSLISGGASQTEGKVNFALKSPIFLNSPSNQREENLIMLQDHQLNIESSVNFSYRESILQS
jgi:hypothetical protein